MKHQTARRFGRSGHFKFGLLLTIAAFTSASCLLPPFDLDISLAHRTASHLDLETEIGPVQLFIGEVGDSDHYFLPSANEGLDAGFLVVAGQNSISIMQIGPNGSGGWSRSGSPLTLLTDNSNPEVFGFQFFPMKRVAGDGDDYGLVVVRSANREYSYYGWDMTNQDHYPANESAWEPITNHVASYEVPTTDPENTLMSRFAKGGGATYSESMYPYQGSAGGAAAGAAVPGTGRSGVSIPGEPITGFYMRDHTTPDDIAYFSTPDGSGHRLYRWDDAQNPEDLGTTSTPVQTLLTTGELYGRGSVTDVVYDADGGETFSIKRGDLYFAGERYLGGTPHLIYTHTFWNKAESEDALYIRVYSIATTNVADLNLE